MHGGLRRGTDYGQAQLGPSDPQKSKLLSRVLTLPLEFISSPVGVGYLVNKAWELRFGCVPGLVHNYKLAPEKGDLSSRLISLLASRSQQDNTFLGHPLGLGAWAPAMTTAARTWVTSSRSLAMSTTSRAKRYAKKQRKEDIREPRKD
jgi:hypothetical protein